MTRRQLLDAGLGASRVNRLITAGALEAVCRGVLAVRGAPDTVERRIWSAVLATQGVVGFATGAALWGVDDSPIGAVDVIVDPARRVVTPPGVRLHRVFVPQAEAVRLDGLPITTRRWTTLDHLGSLPTAAALRLADRALQQRWIRPRDLSDRLEQYPGRAGNGRLREIAARTGDGAAAESERRLHRILREHGITGWVPNAKVHVGGRVVELDVAFPERRLAIEVDGFAFHHDVDRFRGDRRKQNDLVAAGWTVLRFTWADLVERPDYVAALIVGQLAA